MSSLGKDNVLQRVTAKLSFLQEMASIVETVWHLAMRIKDDGSPQDGVTEVSKSKSQKRKGLYRFLCMFEDHYRQSCYCSSIGLQKKGLYVCLDAKTR